MQVGDWAGLNATFLRLYAPSRDVAELWRLADGRLALPSIQTTMHSFFCWGTASRWRRCCGIDRWIPNRPFLLVILVVVALAVVLLWITLRVG